MKRTLILALLTISILALLYFKRDGAVAPPAETTGTFEDAVGMRVLRAPTTLRADGATTDAAPKKQPRHSPDPVPPRPKDSL